VALVWGLLNQTVIAEIRRQPGSEKSHPMRFLVTTLLFIRLLSAPSSAEGQISQRPNALPAVISGFVADPEKMNISAVVTSVPAVFADQLAAQQVKLEETQRILGIIPNFFVAYERDAVSMPASLKFKLAIRAETDVIAFAGTALLAEINQAADAPTFPQSARSHGQRYGAAYAGDASDILIGGAILPSPLHQGPRYFHSGGGTGGQHLNHALKPVLLRHSGNGYTQFSYLGIVGDLASAARQMHTIRRLIMARISSLQLGSRDGWKSCQQPDAGVRSPPLYGICPTLINLAGDERSRIRK
jgi:hypothetical protein